MVAGVFGPAADVAAAAGPEGPISSAKASAGNASSEKHSERRFDESTDIATPLATRRDIGKRKREALALHAFHHHNMTPEPDKQTGQIKFVSGVATAPPRTRIEAASLMPILQIAYQTNNVPAGIGLTDPAGCDLCHTAVERAAAWISERTVRQCRRHHNDVPAITKATEKS